MNGRRLLFGCWAVLGASALTGAAVLQLMGAPRSAVVSVVPRRAPAIAAQTGGRVTAPVPEGTIAPPDPALEAALPDQPGRMLEVIGPDGRRPSVVYRAPRPAVLPAQARLALMVDGIGLDHAASMAAILQLPGSVSLAFSPYADDVEPLEIAARAHGHEMLVSIPMEPQGSPQNDEGDRQLSAANDPAVNARNLRWAMSALRGYVGLTGADTGQGGEHYAADPGGFGDVMKAVAAGGLMYVDPRAPGITPSGAASVGADSVVDTEPESSDLDAELASLVATAQRNGQAVGIAGPLRPVTLARLVSWVRTLPAQGVVLVPVSDVAGMTPAGAKTASAAP